MIRKLGIAFISILTVLAGVGWWVARKAGEEGGLFGPRMAAPAEMPRRAEDLRISRAGSNLIEDFLKFLQPFAGRGAIPGEALLRFASDEEYRKFLASLDAYGLELLGASAGSRTLRVRVQDYRDLFRAAEDGAEAFPNYWVNLPPYVDRESPGVQAGAVGFGALALRWLGIEGDSAGLGRGVTIAIVDSGIEAHGAFGDRSVRVISLVSEDLASPHGHGTAVASLAAGSSGQLSGVAPSAELISVRVTDGEGVSDSFTLSEGIRAAADAGAQIINVSLASQGDSPVVREAVEYAQSLGAVIVASAGNEGLDSMSYPAAYDNVVSVGAIDARGEHLLFSNADNGLDLAAPGLEVYAAWLNDAAIEFSGTSASAPYVTGAIAAVMSQFPGMTSSQAVALLIDSSNEAGAIGPDPYYGAGILNVGRALNSGETGIYDAAVASHYYLPDPSNSQLTWLQVVVENRGTEPFTGASLQIESLDGQQNHVLPTLQPGEVVYRSLLVNGYRAALDGSVTYGSSISLPEGMDDRSPSDNSRRSDFVPAQK
ncbi:MAG TPA: S8 family serine peptidase [Verrucomicrobiales bacterium]|nr:S8 family serine peptidase [Verrucomicrobiales bacterium]